MNIQTDMLFDAVLEALSISQKELRLWGERTILDYDGSDFYDLSQILEV